MLSGYGQNGQYQGSMGDLLPYIAAAFLRAPLLIIDLFSPNNTTGLFLSPGDIFDARTEIHTPFVVVRHSDHFEALLVPQEAEGILQEIYVAHHGADAEEVPKTIKSREDQEIEAAMERMRVAHHKAKVPIAIGDVDGNLIEEANVFLSDDADIDPSDGNFKNTEDIKTAMIKMKKPGERIGRGPAVGIDLGTCYSRIAIFQNDQVWVLKSR